MRVQVQNDRYYLVFPYDQAKVDFCKSLQGSRYHSKERLWSAARSVPNAMDLRTEGFYVDMELFKTTKPKADLRGTWHWTLSPDIKLYQHQAEFIPWCQNRSNLLMDVDMGLGKTLMTMLYFREHGIPPESILIVCPKTIILKWCAELRKFAGIDAIPIMGSTSKKRDALAAKGLHIVNYDYLFTAEDSIAAKPVLRPELAALGKTVLVLDEAHNIKNPMAQRSKVLHTMFPNLTNTILATGTPVAQGVQDYYSLFKMVNPRLLGPSYTAFKNKYCIQESINGAPYVKKIIGYKNVDQLMTIIAPFTFARRKAECMDLPEKVYTNRIVEMTPAQRKVYRELSREFATYVANAAGENQEIMATNILTRGMRLMQICQGFVGHVDENNEKQVTDLGDNPKLDALRDVIEELPPKESLVIMCQFNQDIKHVAALLDRLNVSYGIINGAVSIEDRDKINTKFQLGKLRMVIGQTRAAGVGLDLYKASKMVFFSNSYSIIDRTQAEDRINRIGATADMNLYIDIVTSGGIDGVVLDALRGKRDMASEIYKMVLDFA